MQNQDIIRAVVFMLGADGEYSPNEMRFLHQLCARLELPRKCVIDAFKGINSGKTRIKMPENPEDRSRIMDHLIDAAMCDGNIAPKEQKVLQQVGEKMRISTTEIARRIGSRTSCGVEPDFDINSLTADDLLGTGTKASQKVLARCPKCGYEAVDPDDTLIQGLHGTGECPFCGVITAKYRPKETS